jgi:Protein of unknown function (DUF3551)
MKTAGTSTVAALALTCCLGRAAHATDFGLPWCIVYTGDYARVCDFRTKAECDATASGNVGWCTPNPAYFSSTEEAYRSLAPQPIRPTPNRRQRAI